MIKYVASHPNRMSKRGLLLGLVALLVSMSFAGCLGGDEADVDAGDGGANDDETGLTNETADDNTTDDGPAPPVDNAEVDDPPRAAFDIVLGNATNATVGTPVDFNASASVDPEGGNLSYAWDFGDGQGGEGLALNHTFDEVGNYTITLTVTDEGGLTHTTNQTLAVVNATAPSGSFETVSDSLLLMNPLIAQYNTLFPTLDDHKANGGMEGTHWNVHTFEGVPEGINQLRFKADYSTPDGQLAMKLVIKIFPEDGSAAVGSSSFPSGRPDVTLEAEDLGESTYHVFVYIATGVDIAYDLTVSYE